MNWMGPLNVKNELQVIEKNNKHGKVEKIFENE